MCGSCPGAGGWRWRLMGVLLLPLLLLRASHAYGQDAQWC